MQRRVTITFGMVVCGAFSADFSVVDKEVFLVSNDYDFNDFEKDTKKKF